MSEAASLTHLVTPSPAPSPASWAGWDENPALPAERGGAQTLEPGVTGFPAQPGPQNTHDSHRWEDETRTGGQASGTVQGTSISTGGETEAQRGQETCLRLRRRPPFGFLLRVRVLRGQHCTWSPGTHRRAWRPPLLAMGPGAGTSLWASFPHLSNGADHTFLPGLLWVWGEHPEHRPVSPPG